MAATTKGPGLLVLPTMLKEGGPAVAEGEPLSMCIVIFGTSSIRMTCHFLGVESQRAK
jgi:hypothetical protein